MSNKRCFIGGGTIFSMIVFALVMFIFWPLFVVWALNTLFKLTIAYTFKTWLAALILIGAVKSTVKEENKTEKK